MSKTRFAIALLAGLGAADSLYMLAYEEGWIHSLACPFFGEGCNRVGRSRHARHFGVPNALVGVLGYASLAGLALARPQTPAWNARRRQTLLAISLAAATAGVYLTWEQKTKVRHWCFWCLTSTAISLAIVPLAGFSKTESSGHNAQH